MDNLEQVEEVDEVEELEDLQGVDLEGNNEELVPEIIVKPTVGMFFDSPDEMFEYYKGYGLQEGFPVMRRSCRKGDDGSLRYVTFTCGRNGKSKAKDTNVLRLQPNQKIGCNAKLGGRFDLVTGKWVIGNMILEHNHAVSPSKSRYYRCNRTISPFVKKQLEINDEAGIRMAQSFKSVVVEAGGFEKVSFLEKDARNHIDKVRRLRLGEGDVVAIQRYFKKMQTENNGFFFSLDLDEEGRLKNVFWADPRSRAAYKDFGDVVTFDTTYLTNKYDMPFAPFVGVNHHDQSILLGCGLISHEDTETFTWLFDTWLSCMSGSPPLGIITDQDKAMKNAIEIVFPNTRHRWCLWHILKKVPEKLGRYVQYHAIRVSLHSVVYDSYTPVEFEEAWHGMLDKYDLINNQWLNGLYEERNRWVPCFVKNSFWAGMSTTQRSESMNAFFDGYVNSKTTLKQFVEKYEKAMESKIEKEWQTDARCFSQRMPCRTSFAMEKQVEAVYTISKFQEFQQELANKIYCEVFSCGGSEYEVIENDEQSREKTLKVFFGKNEGEIHCVCKMFEYKGILCRHAITVLSRNHIQLLPEKYILRRWRKDVRRFYSKVKVSYDSRNSSIEHQQYIEECTAFYDVAEVASKNEESHKNIMGWIEKAMKDVSLNVRSDGDDTYNYGGSGSYTEIIQDPVVTRRKGRPPTQRKQKQFKRPKQKSNNASTSTTVEVATTVPTQESHMTLLAQQAPFEHAFFPPYYQSWMNYGGVHHGNLQYFPQQNLEEANRGEFSSNEPST
ncbi:protein FAR1-RELATED SEQUENCE [Citrus sinensis]|uniref:protein FAR1-RELATED SEQUENCE 5-like n=1 Tax=Citrus sinensis TaxID=2711 RepID=UPI002197BF97|nr:protein FAR1-RELATED SEQUENCE 5-like [Citrus sinensis]KAH9760448.1 protein FAR1-RELATED SEQUENCE [Citrus sinensis]